MVCNAFRIVAFDDSFQFVRQYDLFLFDNLVVADDIQPDVRGNDSQPADLLFREEAVGNLYDTFFTELLALEIVTDGNVVRFVLQIQQ